eukprot:11471243-Alexandrium_andersonii.AAC.1
MTYAGGSPPCATTLSSWARPARRSQGREQGRQGPGRSETWTTCTASRRNSSRPQSPSRSASA